MKDRTNTGQFSREDVVWNHISSEAIEPKRKPRARKRWKVTKLEPAIPRGSGLRGKRRGHVLRSMRDAERGR